MIGGLKNMDWILIKKPLLDWYQDNHRDLAWRKTKNPYYIWISEIMLQQTRVEAVKDYYNRFLADIPDIKTLANASEDLLLKKWEGLGYYNRVRNLQKAAVLIMNNYNGQFPMQYDEIIQLPGIGEYTAGAISSICFGLPTPAVDGNVLRIVMRISNSYENIDLLSTKRKVRNQLLELYQEGRCDEMTQALMELGAIVCVPNGIPRCAICPLKKYCKAYDKNTYHLIPVRNEKKKRRIVDKTVFILHVKDRYAIRKRMNKGLLANLWEFYNIDQKMNPQEAMHYLNDQGFHPMQLEKEVHYKHIFTHVEWRMVAYYITCSDLKEGFVWVSKESFDSDYALPTAFKAFIEKEF